MFFLRSIRSLRSRLNTDSFDPSRWMQPPRRRSPARRQQAARLGACFSIPNQPGWEQVCGARYGGGRGRLWTSTARALGAPPWPLGRRLGAESAAGIRSPKYPSRRALQSPRLRSLWSPMARTKPRGSPAWDQKLAASRCRDGFHKLSS